MPVRLLAGSALAVFAGVFAFAEAAHWRSSHRRLGDCDTSAGRRSRSDRWSSPGVRALTAAGRDETTADSDQIIIVLGYANRGQRPNGINRFRVRAGLRSIDPTARSTLLIFCGGAVTGRTPEALILERFARDELGFTGRAVLEEQSTTTWENIANAIPIIDRELTPATTISIVSNSHHAEKARDHLWQMRPDLARRLVRGGDYRFGEQPLVKPIAAVRGLLALRALDRENAKHAAGH
ncbi:YdcF family protein [Brevibacterium sediminis]|uniref:YdcF family protein n=1 Tax=Brevibacterium sediminis TaxID=1857024 RepID=UPI00217558BE|nr:YdcF family protein [Brevibacterium sediminis]MCS4594969.1 YdcF family protein [Brevibacterium sediminis]